MADDAGLRALVREALLQALANEGEGGAAAAPSSVQRMQAVQAAGAGPSRPFATPEQAALGARVAAWLGRPRSGPPGTGSWAPARDRAGYIASTPARLGVGRAGTRCRTQTVLEFRADHAAARDAVHSEIEPAFMESLGVLPVRSAAADKRQFLLRPDLGRRLSEEARAEILRSCATRPQIQIVVGDGLSATAIRVNLPLLLPSIVRRLQEARLQVGRTVFVANARVAVADEVGDLLNAELICMLVGERPGLKSAESVGAYITYYAGRTLVEAQRSVISNIHAGGIPPEQGAAQVAALILRAMGAHGTGIDLEQS